MKHFLSETGQDLSSYTIKYTRDIRVWIGLRKAHLLSTWDQTSLLRQANLGPLGNAGDPYWQVWFDICTQIGCSNCVSVLFLDKMAPKDQTVPGKCPLCTVKIQRNEIYYTNGQKSHIPMSTKASPFAIGPTSILVWEWDQQSRKQALEPRRNSYTNSNFVNQGNKILLYKCPQIYDNSCGNETDGAGSGRWRKKATPSRYGRSPASIVKVDTWRVNHTFTNEEWIMFSRCDRSPSSTNMPMSVDCIQRWRCSRRGPPGPL